ncbi:autophagy-related protein 11 [Entomortierella parvispora]|uniref:Autophagy-related protein 11 n=1 Tax=Entomortierella parvispora TaxID=205924 RepID=A0A9P3M0N0_9FUNG|nr:autophagy-related protein 11 [Entomortierella parvispora]
MVYNREVLTTDISSSILTLTEQAKTEPPIPSLSPAQLQAVSVPNRPESPTAAREWGNQFHRTFEAYVDHIMACYKAIVAHAGVCERIMEELRMQSLAVQVALTNLDAHSRSVLETFEKFNTFATKDLTKQARLLQSFPRDIEALRQIKVHPALLPTDSPDRYISDFIPTDKLVLWAERCREIHDGLMRDGRELSKSIKEVQEGTLAIRSNSGINLEQLEDAMSDILQTVEQQSEIRHRVERDQTRIKERLTEIFRAAGLSAAASTVDALGKLANVYVTDYMESSHQADEMLRNKLGIFISAKRSQTANLISQLMHISKLQSTIASIPPSLGHLDDSLRKRDADFSQLVYVQRIPIAYGALVVEIVRRREYSKLLLTKSQQLAEVMSRFRQMEQRRRDSFRSEVAKFVPVVVPGLDDVPPFCEINALNTKDRLPPFTREHVAEFERLVQQLSVGIGGQDGTESNVMGVGESSTGASSINSGQETNQDALSKLRVTLAKMTTQMDVMGGEFERILEKSFLTERIQRLEEDNARLRSDMSRVDVQQRSGTPQQAQNPFPRQSTPIGGVGASSAGVGSASTVAAGGMSVNQPVSPKLNRQPSRGNSSTPIGQRLDSDEQHQILQQQFQQNQKLSKENTELSSKIKAYETRIRSLEETLYQNFRAGTGADASSSSSKDLRQTPGSPSSDQPWKAPEDIQAARSQSQAKEQERRRDEERLVALEQDLEDLSHKLEETEGKLRNEYTISQQALATNDELRQELLELKLQSATLEGESNINASDSASAKRVIELDEELQRMTLKCEHLIQHHENETQIQAVETKAFKDRIEELSNQLGLEKEILEGQLAEARRTADEANERAIELENELAVVNEELQNKVLELEEELENHATEHEEVTARALEQERQLESHRAVHTDILAQLNDQESKVVAAQEAEKQTKEEHKALQEVHDQLQKEHDQLTKSHSETTQAQDELAQQVSTLRQQVSELEAQREAYKTDVNLRLEDAKTMVRRAEEDWKEKSRLLEQTVRATKALAKPIRDCIVALGKESPKEDPEPTDLSWVRERIQDISRSIQSLVEKHDADHALAQANSERQLAELTKEHDSSKDILEQTISTLKESLQKADSQADAVKLQLQSTIDRLKEEMDSMKVQQRASAIPVPVSSTPKSGSPDLSTCSPATPVPPSRQPAPLTLGSSETFSREDRILLGTLALELGIPLPTLSKADDLSDVLSPTSSVLLDNSEKRSMSRSELLTPTPTTAQMGSSIVTTTGGSSGSSSRSSSTTIPLSTEILQTFDFSDLDVTKATSLVKKKLMDTEHLLKRWQRECKNLKEKYNRAWTEAHEKIAFRNFKVDDLTLFLPTRNSASKPWAAFNINCPHYFLQMTPQMATQLQRREWIVARITSITEAVVDKRHAPSQSQTEGESSSSSEVSSHNPFGLAEGIKYYLLEATSWSAHHSHGHGHGHGKSSSSYHSSSAREGSSSKLRHHSSTSALGESSSSSRHERERSKDRRDKERESDRRRHRDEEAGTQLSTHKEETVSELQSSHERKGSTSGTCASAASPGTIPSSVSNPSLLSLMHPTTGQGLGESQASLATTTTTASGSSSTPVGSSSQALKDRLASHGHIVAELPDETGSSSTHVPLTGQSSNRHSTGASSTAPISIPFQSAATNALRAISSSVGSTGSGGSGSISSLLAHQLGGGSGSGSGSGMSTSATAILAASSPPRNMLLSSSPHKTGVSTVSAVGTTVSVNTGATTTAMTGSHTSSASGGGHSPGMASSAVFGSSSVPVHPSRLSLSSNRDDLEQLAVFATDEEQEQDRELQQQQQQQQQQHHAVGRGFHRTSSSTSTWHGHPAGSL